MTELLITSSALILIVLALRRLFRGRVSLRLQYALWLLVALRLLIPGSLFQSPVSVLTGAETVTHQVAELRHDTPDTPVMNSDTILSPAAPVTDSAPPALSVSGDAAAVQTAPAASPAPALVSLISWADAARFVWYAGMIVMALWFLLSNLNFRRELKYGAEPVAVSGSPLPVYVTGGVSSPCLYGLFRPAIYVTRDCLNDEQKLRHVVAHEATHRRHGDQLWSLVRCVCLVVWWFNPLVWLAAILSRRDCELACDEGALKRLGEDERLAYGRTLIGVVAQSAAPGMLLRTATTMSGGKKAIRERVTLIAKRPKMTAATLTVVLLITVLAAVCTFSGAVDTETLPPTEHQENNLITDTDGTEPSSNEDPKSSISPIPEGEAVITDLIQEEITDLIQEEAFDFGRVLLGYTDVFHPVADVWTTETCITLELTGEAPVTWLFAPLDYDKTDPSDYQIVKPDHPLSDWDASRLFAIQTDEYIYYYSIPEEDGTGPELVFVDTASSEAADPSNDPAAFVQALYASIVGTHETRDFYAEVDDGTVTRLRITAANDSNVDNRGNHLPFYQWQTTFSGKAPSGASLTLVSADGASYIKCWEGSELVLLHQDGEDTWMTATPDDGYSLYDFLLLIAENAVWASIKAVTVDGSITDYQAVLDQYMERIAANWRNAPDWMSSKPEDTQAGSSTVRGAYFGEGENFSASTELYIKIDPFSQEAATWQAGAGLYELENGPYNTDAGYYAYWIARSFARNENGDWYCTGTYTGGLGIKFPTEPEEATVEQLVDYFYHTTEFAHDYYIPMELRSRSADELSSLNQLLAARSDREVEEFCTLMGTNLAQYPDYAAMKYEDFAALLDEPYRTYLEQSYSSAPPLT